MKKDAFQKFFLSAALIASFSLILILAIFTGVPARNGYAAAVSTTVSSTTAPTLYDVIKQLQNEIILLQTKLYESHQRIINLELSGAFGKNMKKKDKNEDVARLQNLLKKFPAIYPEGVVNGYFDDKTEKAVMVFQQKEGLDVTGIVDNKTRDTLRDVAAALLKSEGEVQEFTPIDLEQVDVSNFGIATQSSTADLSDEPPVDLSTPDITLDQLGTVSDTSTSVQSIISPSTTATSSTIDIFPPKISNIGVKNITKNSATVTWTTDELSSSQVSYSNSSKMVPLYTVNGAGPVKSHNVVLNNLLIGNTYRYYVTSKDASGNVATSSVQSFQTGKLTN